jgi:hypothetical protein
MQSRWVLHIRVRVEGWLDSVLFDEGQEPRPHGDPSLVRLEDLDPKSLHLPEHRVHFSFGAVVRKSVGQRKEIDLRLIELRANFFEIVQGSGR